ncbi:hypothetical protein D3C76_1715110 [compost metagenome]
MTFDRPRRGQPVMTVRAAADFALPISMGISALFEESPLLGGENFSKVIAVAGHRNQVRYQLVPTDIGVHFRDSS